MASSSGLIKRARSPQSAAVAGIAFAVILGAVILLLQGSLSTSATGAPAWLEVDSHQNRVRLAIYLVPFAGIAFLWFIGVIRFRLGALEDKLFATVFLGSGLLFICMLFAAGAVVGTLLTLSAQPAGASDDIARMSGALTSALLATFGTRMAAVFVAVVTTAGRRAKVVPRWLMVFGYVTTLALFVAPPGVVLIQLLFPAWVLILSVDILIRTPTDSR